MIRVLVDENIPLNEEFQAPDMEIIRCAGRGLSNSDLEGIDALLVRSVTQVDRMLLEGSSVGFVGSATAGIDHLDTNYLNEAGIVYSYAPGSNATSVVDYVLCCLAAVGRDPRGASVGIVGCGQVGGRLYRRMKSLGCDCYCYDPFLTEEQQPDLCDLEKALSADIVSLHTPLTDSGPYPTLNMIKLGELEQLREGGVLINAGRGGVINEFDLKSYISKGVDIRLILDVWSGEPNINRELVELCQIATPHIAGYAARSKLRGRQMVLEALFKHFDLGHHPPQSYETTLNLPVVELDSWDRALLSVYDPQEDDRKLRADLEGFDRLRKNYPARSELAEYGSENVILQSFGFSEA